MSAKIPTETFIGLKFNNLTIIEALPRENGYRYVIVKCDCGKTKRCSLDNVKTGKSKTCGCLPKPIKHGLIDHPIYKIWCKMKYRCYNKKAVEYKWYGAEGVIVCDEWLNDFQAFYTWAISNGWAKGLEIDKDIKGGKIYSPDNCCFVTKKVNCNNRRSNKYLTLNDETLTVAQWSDRMGISQQVIYRRMKNGWSVSESLTQPLMVNQFG